MCEREQKPTAIVYPSTLKDERWWYVERRGDELVGGEWVATEAVGFIRDRELAHDFAMEEKHTRESAEFSVDLAEMTVGLMIISVASEIGITLADLEELLESNAQKAHEILDRIGNDATELEFAVLAGVEAILSDDPEIIEEATNLCKDTMSRNNINPEIVAVCIADLFVSTMTDV